MVKPRILWQRSETTGEENSAGDMFLNEKIQQKVRTIPIP